MRVFTENYMKRLAQANAACRRLREIGFRVRACTVRGGDSLEKSRIEISGGAHHPRFEFEGCVVTRRIGGD